MLKLEIVKYISILFYNSISSFPFAVKERSAPSMKAGHELMQVFDMYKSTSYIGFLYRIQLE